MAEPGLTRSPRISCKEANIRKDAQVRILALALIFIKGSALPAIMGGVALNTLFIILLAATLALFTVYYILDSAETAREFGGFEEITGKVQSFEITADEINLDGPAKKTTERYDNKFFKHLESIQASRDKTFMKGKVFLEEE